MVADNDLAIDLFVEYISNSPIWKESAVFIVSYYFCVTNGRANFGITAHETVRCCGYFFMRMFSSDANTTTYQALLNRIALDKMNTIKNELSRRSESLI